MPPARHKSINDFVATSGAFASVAGAFVSCAIAESPKAEMDANVSIANSFFIVVFLFFAIS